MNLTAYLINSSACICLSYFLFLLLGKKLWLVRQRIFLTASIVLSFCLPLTHATITFDEKPDQITPYNDLQLPAIGQVPASSLMSSESMWHIVYNIYMAVACIFILSLIFQILRIAWLYNICEKSNEGKFTILRSEKIKSPFSFFRWIFIPSGLKDSQESGSIFIHESIHSSQLHSADNLVVGAACAIMWFNPVIWMIKKSLHLIHEYLADEGTIRKGVEKTGYQALLINQAAGSKLIIIHSGFNNFLKKRIIMMTKQNMKESRNARILSFIPLPVLLLMAVSIINGLLPGKLNAQKQETKKDPPKEVVVIGYGRQKQEPGISKKDTINYIVDGISVKSISDINPDSIESMNVLKEDNTIIIRTKGFSRSNLKTKKIDFRSANGPEKILYIMDEKEVSEDDIKNVSPEDIESISVHKHDESIKRYTTKDYDGVIIVTRKKTD